MDTTLAGLPRVFAVHDDLIVRGKGNANEAAPKDHDENIHPLPQGCWEKGNKLNEDKAGYMYAGTLYLGHVVSKTNLKTIDVIKRLQQPRDKAAIQCLLGMAGYIQKFAPHLSEIATPLWLIVKKKQSLSGFRLHCRALANSKRRMWELPVLWYFDLKVERTTLQCDTSG